MGDFHLVLVGDELVEELEVLGEVAGSGFADIKHVHYLPGGLTHVRGLMINRW